MMVNSQQRSFTWTLLTLVAWDSLIMDSIGKEVPKLRINYLFTKKHVRAWSTDNLKKHRIFLLRRIDYIDGLNYHTEPGIIKIIIPQNQGLATWVSEKGKNSFSSSFPWYRWFVSKNVYMAMRNVLIAKGFDVFEVLR